MKCGKSGFFDIFTFLINVAGTLKEIKVLSGEKRVARDFHGVARNLRINLARREKREIRTALLIENK